MAAWREAPYFTGAERAALALTEAATRLSDRADPVPGEIWDEAARHYDEPALAALPTTLISLWTRYRARCHALQKRIVYDDASDFKASRPQNTPWDKRIAIFRWVGGTS